jgi:hypothetical protein
LKRSLFLKKLSPFIDSDQTLKVFAADGEAFDAATGPGCFDDDDGGGGGGGGDGLRFIVGPGALSVTGSPMRSPAQKTTPTTMGSSRRHESSSSTLITTTLVPSAASKAAASRGGGRATSKASLDGGSSGGFDLDLSITGKSAK